MRKLNLPFYLTGGTALSRFFFNHRYSDDLDLFVNDDSQFKEYIQALYNEVKSQTINSTFSIDYTRTRQSRDYFQLFIQKRSDEKTVELKVDFVNDVAPHFGEFVYDSKLGKLDSLRNILSNKLSAIFRFDVKDIVDIWIIAKNYSFYWNEIINEARRKELGVDAIEISNVLNSFPIEELNRIKWINKPSSPIFSKEIKQIANDIFFCEKNTLVP